MKTFLEYVTEAKQELEESDKVFMDLVDESLKLLRTYFHNQHRDRMIEVDNKGLFKTTKELEPETGIDRDIVEDYLKNQLHENDFMVNQIIDKLIRDKWLNLQERKNTPFSDLLLPTEKFVNLPV